MSPPLKRTIQNQEKKIAELNAERTQSANERESPKKENNYMAVSSAGEIIRQRQIIESLNAQLEQMTQERDDRQCVLNRHIWLIRQSNDECDRRVRNLYQSQISSLSKDGSMEDEED